MSARPWTTAGFAVLLALGASALPAAGVEPANGRLVFVGEEGDSWGRIYTMAADGTDVVALTDSDQIISGPEYSPDGRRIVYASSRDAYSNIYVMAADGTAPQRLTETAWIDGGDIEPTWSPDGMRIVFTSTRDQNGDENGGFELYSMAADGSQETRLTNTGSQVDDQQPSISPDGTKVAFVSDRPIPDYDFTDLFVLDLVTGDVSRLTFDAEPDENHFGHYVDDPVWSPDGTRLLFSSDRTMNQEIWMIDADGTDLVNLTDHPDTDSDPAWSPDGSTITWTSSRSGQYDVWSMPAPSPEVAARVSHSAPRATNLTPGDGVSGSQADWQTRRACTVVGTPGPDVLTGTARADVVCGRGGDDVLRGAGGRDELRGGPGADTLVGGPGGDNALGDAGSDRLRLRDDRSGNDQGDGGLGDDTCLGDRRDLCW